MKTANWNHLLEGLISATVQGRASWTPGDASESWVLASPDGSVVVRRPTYAAGPVQALGDRAISVEVRSRGDQTVDRLPTTLERAGSLGRAFALETDEDEPSPADVPLLREKAIRLFDAIVENHQDGSDVADAILRHLGA